MTHVLSHWAQRLAKPCLPLLWPVVCWGQVPPGSADAVTPPAITLPTTPPTAGMNTPNAGSMAPIGPSSGTSVSGQQFSYGDAPYSIMFTPSQIDGMKAALKSFETVGSPKTSPEVTVANPATEQPAASEPALYPTFYLSSIVYHSASDWIVWLKRTPSQDLLAGPPPAANGAIPPSMLSTMPGAVPASSDGGMIRITPKSKDNEISALHVSATSVEFSWHPSYAGVIAQRRAGKLFANTHSVAHRIAGSQEIHFDDGEQTVRFTLKQNQSFASSYFEIFEGLMVPAMPPALSAAPAAFPNQGTGMPIQGTMTPANAETINGLLGQKSPASPAHTMSPVPTPPTTAAPSGAGSPATHSNDPTTQP